MRQLECVPMPSGRFCLPQNHRDKQIVAPSASLQSRRFASLSLQIRIPGFAPGVRRFGALKPFFASNRQCFAAEASADHHFEIFISPELDDACRVGDVLLHECIHAVVGLECKHRGKFRSTSIKCGLTGDMKATVPSDELKARLETLVEKIGPYRMAEEILPKLETLGYKGYPAIFNAADYGVPQRRRRMVFIASRIGSIEYCPPISKKDRVFVKDAIKFLPSPEKTDDLLHGFPEQRSPEVLKIIKMIPHDGGSRRLLGKSFQLNCHKDSDGFKDIYGRMSWNDVSPTITGGCVNPSKGRFLHPEEDRAITLREAALLQSFPREYYFSLEKGKYKAALMIGNAFPPKFAQVHAKNIIQALKANAKENMS